MSICLYVDVSMNEKTYGMNNHILHMGSGDKSICRSVYGSKLVLTSIWHINIVS